MTKRFHPRLLAGLIAAGALLVPSAAFGQTADTGAPTAGSPPANQYEIPLQAGRKDAAPSNSQGKGSSNGSLYRSNNNFGSSSVIPGDPGSGGGDGGAGGAGGTGDNPNGSASGPNSGGESGSANDSNGLDTGAPSELAAYTTIPLLVILGAVIGIAGVRMRRRAEV